MEAVRHFLGFADDSDARVRGTACWRRLVMVGELPQRLNAAECGCCLDESSQQARAGKRSAQELRKMNHSSKSWAALPGSGPLRVSGTQTGTTMPSSPGINQIRR